MDAKFKANDLKIKHYFTSYESYDYDNILSDYYF